MNIAVLDSNQKELDIYSKLCRLIGDEYGYTTNIKAFPDTDSFFFEMDDGASMHTTDIIIIDPQTAASAAQTLRSMKFKGVILYLTKADDLHFSMQGYDAEVFNYLKKGEPHLVRFKKVFERALHKAETLWSEYIVLKNRDECVRLALRDIYYFATLNHIVTAYHSGGEFDVRATMAELEERLSQHGFVRTHKSYLVALASVLNASREAIQLVDGTALPVGDVYYPGLRDMGVAKNLSIVAEPQYIEAGDPDQAIIH
jgi:DNA-binding LytR/AlgR family response regulator